MPRTTSVARLVAAVLLPVLVLAGVLAGVDRAGANPSESVLNVRYFNVGQADSRWGPTEMYSGDRAKPWLIGRCGCQLAAYTGMIWRELHVGAGVGGGPANAAQPFFPTTVNDYVWEISNGDGTRTRIVLDEHQEAIFSPHYLDRFFRDPAYGGRENWGYQNGTGVNIGCGSPIQPWAMEEVGVPATQLLPGPDGAPMTVQVGPSGISATIHTGFDQGLVDANLAAGIPTIIGREYRLPNGQTGGHYQVIVGFDASHQRYRYADPAHSTGSYPSMIVPEADYQKWLSEIVETVDVRPSFGRSQHLVLGGRGGAPSGFAATATVGDATPAYELTAVLPDGELVGFDPSTGERIATDDGYAYDTRETGSVDGTEGAINGRQRNLVTNGNPEGVTRTIVTGTGTGAYDIELFDVGLDGMRTDLGTASGTVAPGQEVKHEVTYDENGVVSAVAVDNFTPEPVLDDLQAVAGEPLVLDGSDSFDVDGRVVGFAWDLGDGSTATGDTVTHTFAAPGTYAVSLAVTDDRGATRTETVAVEVAPSELDAPAIDVTLDPASGWATDEVAVSIDATDGGSGVAHLTTSADGADAQAESTTAGDHAEVVVDAEGRTTVRAVATDAMGNVSGAELVDVGIDRTGPTTAVRTPGADRPTSRLAVLGGTASDLLSGVASVEVLLRRADGDTWDGTAWVDGDRWLPADGTDAWALVAGLPTGADLPDGQYVVQARATDAAGNVGAPSAPVTATVQAATAGLPVVELAPPGDRDSTAGFDVDDQGRAVGRAGRLGLNDALPVGFTADGTPNPLPRGTRPGAEAVAVNGTGDAAGWVYDGFSRRIAAAWVDGQVVELGSATTGGFSVALDIDDDGVAVGSSTYAGGGSRQRAARFAGGIVSLLPDLGGASSEATASNELGDVVGWSSRPGISDAPNAFLLPAGGGAAQPLPALPLPDDPDAVTYGIAYDINDDGTIVGSDNGHAVRWTDGTVADLGEGEAFAVDEVGTAVGVVYTAEGMEATLWEGTRATDLNDLIDAGSGCVLERAEGISDDGRFVTGTGTLAGEPRGFVLDLGGTTGGGGGDDTTPPSSTATAPSGWVNTPVEVALEATDAGSGVARIITNLGVVEGAAGTVTVDAEGTTTVVHAAEDLAGNIEAPGSVTVRIDRLAPVATVSTPASDWHHGPVTVTVGGHDATSGVATLRVQVDGGPALEVEPGPFAVAAEGEHLVSVVAVDAAGNESDPATTTVRVDGTGPAITFHQPADGSSVPEGTAVLASAADTGSGLEQLTLALVTGDLRQPFANGGLLVSPGPATVEATAVDAAGNRSTTSITVTVLADAPPPAPTGRPPVVDAGGPYEADGGELFTLDGAGSTDPDGDPLTYEWLLDGVHLDTGPTVSLRLDPGTYLATLVVGDGQWTTSAHTVVEIGEAPPAPPTYVFDGFEQPVDMGIVNVANAGRAIPLKWAVHDGAGRPVLGLTSVTVASVPVACEGRSAASDAVEEYAAGSSGLRSLGDGRYQFNWDTPRSYAGQCRVVRVDLGDGQLHTATFRFR